MKANTKEIERSITEAEKNMKSMTQEEIHQHVAMDARYRSMQQFEFETYIR